MLLIPLELKQSTSLILLCLVLTNVVQMDLRFNNVIFISIEQNVRFHLGLLSRTELLDCKIMGSITYIREKWFNNHINGTKLMRWKTTIWCALSLARNTMSI